MYLCFGPAAAVSLCFLLLVMSLFLPRVHMDLEGLELQLNVKEKSLHVLMYFEALL